MCGWRDGRPWVSDPRREQLRAELVRLRTLASIGQRAMGAAIGASHGTVRRIEIGDTPPKAQYVRLWLDAVAAKDPSLVDAATRARLLGLVESVHAETRGWDDLLGAEGHMQSEIASREAAATLIRNYQDEIVPGLLQTPEYARALFESGQTTNVAAAVAGRIERQRALREGGRTFVFLMAQRVLSRPIGGPDVLAEQRDRIVSLSRLPSVEVAVLPDGAAPVVVWHNYTLWDTPDGTYAAAETIWGETRTQETVQVERAETLWRQMWEVAVHGDEAVALIRS